MIPAWHTSRCGLMVALVLLGLSALACLTMPTPQAVAAQSTPTANVPPADAPVIILTVKQGVTIKCNLSGTAEAPAWLESTPGEFQQITVGTDLIKGSISITTSGTTLKIYGPVTSFDCSINNENITALDVSKNTGLNSLLCTDNKITSLDISKNTALQYLRCDTNMLTTLDVSKNTALEFLSCFTNQLTTLDVHNNTALEYLDCSDNKLTSLILNKNEVLQLTYTGNNALTKANIQRR